MNATTATQTASAETTAAAPRVAFIRCWSCPQNATHRMTREGAPTIHACDRCTDTWRDDAGQSGFTVEKMSIAAADTHPITTLAAEDFQPGYRYWAVRPGCEDAWTIASVEIHTAEYEVSRDGGEWFSPEIVTITRRDGNVRHLEKGEMVAIQGPWKTV